MTTLAGLPYVELPFDKRGDHEPFPPLCPPGTTDLLVLSHGWKNDTLVARKLYEDIARHMLDAGGSGSGRTFALAGVIWPAFAYQPDLSLLPETLDPQKVDKPAAAVGDVDVEPDALRDYARQIGETLEMADPGAFADNAVIAGGGGGAADDLVDVLRAKVVGKDAAPDDARADHKSLFRGAGRDVVESRANPPAKPLAQGSEQGKTAFFKEGVQQFLRFRSGGRAAVARVLNQFTYYEMKARAGVVGHTLGRLLDAADLQGVRVHLIGHSFGARLVTAAANAMDSLEPASMTLLQGAFSHNGLGQDIGGKGIDGAFRRVITQRRIKGAIAATHTQQDSAVGFFYALASLTSGDVGKSFGVTCLIGGPGDLHGGMGANGAQSMPPDEVTTLTAVQGTLPVLTAGKVNNILADAIIKNHNDVDNPEAARVVWAAITSGG